MNAKSLRCRFPKPDAVLRLVCFPWAGGGGTYYANWGNRIFDDVEVYSIVLPGRENRFCEPLCTDWFTLVQDLSRDLYQNLKGKPFAFWGHSMGAGLSCETAKYMKKVYGIEPVHMLLSGASAPQDINNHGPSLATLSDEELEQKIRSWGGTPAAVLENKEIMKLSVQILRADLTLLRNYRLSLKAECSPLTCPVTCFDGTSDLHNQQGWAELTKGPYDRHTFVGGHFYFMENDNESAVLQLISQILGVICEPEFPV